MQVLLLDLGRELRGGQWQVYYLARALAASGAITPIVAAPRRSPLLTQVETLQDVRSVALPSAREWDPRNLHAMRKLVFKEGVRLVHTHCARSASLGGFCKKLWQFRVLLVHSRRVSYPLKKGWSGQKYLLGDAIAAVSQEIGDVMIDSGMPKERVTVIHSGIDTTRYVPKRERNDGRYVIGMVGALTKQKGYEVLLDALAELKKYDNIPPWEARLIGAGPLFQELVAQAEELGVEDRIAMLGWQDSRDFMPDFDTLAVPSVDGEGSSGVIKEGWATGIPVVCSDLASNLELVVDGNNGLTFPNGDAKALAKHLAALATEHSLRNGLITEGSASAAQFSDSRMAQSYLTLYKKLAS